MSELDTTRQARSPSDLVALAHHVYDGDPNNELDWIEWKIGLDLSSSEGQFAVAKQILGFANRDPDKAATAMGGCAYFLLGIEPGQIVGQAPMDPAKIEEGLRRYIEHGSPQWTPTWVTIEEKNCLVITVEPPQWGDDIRALQREFGNFAAGAIFVRRPGGTHTASPSEIRILEKRLRSERPEPPLVEVRVLSEDLLPLDYSESARREWIDREREWLMTPLKRASKPGQKMSISEARAKGYLPPGLGQSELEKFARVASDVSRTMASLGIRTEPDPRSNEGYRAEVEDYLTNAADRIEDAAVEAFIN